ncbi:MAG TPA: LysR substrate-binding domain-containing protein, partial [Bordetella sp.]
DDYAAFLLPPVLARFGEAHPLVTVEMICEPSVQLVRAVDEGRLDLAITMRVPDRSMEFLRRERLVWVASPHHVPWQNDPLPIALFAPGCIVRTEVLRALGQADRAYRCTYSSPSLLGLLAVVQAGLAVTGLALCSVPSNLRIIGEAEGLPTLADAEVGIFRSPGAMDSAVKCLDGFLRRELTVERDRSLAAEASVPLSSLESARLPSGLN